MWVLANSTKLEHAVMTFFFFFFFFFNCCDQAVEFLMKILFTVWVTCFLKHRDTALSCFSKEPILWEQGSTMERTRVQEYGALPFRDIPQGSRSQRETARMFLKWPWENQWTSTNLSPHPPNPCSFWVHLGHSLWGGSLLLPTSGQSVQPRDWVPHLRGFPHSTMVARWGTTKILRSCCLLLSRIWMKRWDAGVEIWTTDVLCYSYHIHFFLLSPTHDLGTSVLWLRDPWRLTISHEVGKMLSRTHWRLFLTRSLLFTASCFLWRKHLREETCHRPVFIEQLCLPCQVQDGDSNLSSWFHQNVVHWPEGAYF